MLQLPPHFTPGLVGPEPTSTPIWWFIFVGNQLLVQTGQVNITSGETHHILMGASRPACAGQAIRQLFMGHYGEIPCFALEIAADTPLPENSELCGLRGLWGQLSAEQIGLAGQALQLIEWDRCHQFCGRCGQPTVLRDNERSKHCPACGLNHYPRHAPAVMVRITRGDEILLARSPHFAPGMYSVIAGFVDPGESIEQAAHREVMEEVGLTVKNLRYFTSQSWPFPHSLMIAFTADYAGGDICIDDDEIEDAGWYKRDNLPVSPITMSISRALIDDWLSCSV